MTRGADNAFRTCIRVPHGHFHWLWARLYCSLRKLSPFLRLSHKMAAANTSKSGEGGLRSPQTRWMRRRPGFTCTCQCGPRISPTASRKARQPRAPVAVVRWCQVLKGPRHGAQTKTCGTWGRGRRVGSYQGGLAHIGAHFAHSWHAVGARQRRTWRAPTRQLAHAKSYVGARQLVSWRAPSPELARQLPCWRTPNQELARQLTTWRAPKPCQRVLISSTACCPDSPRPLPPACAWGPAGAQPGACPAGPSTR